MHFKNQHARFVGEKATFSKSRSLRSVEGLTHCADRRESRRADTDSRLLTERNRSRISSSRKAVAGRISRSRLDRQPTLLKSRASLRRQWGMQFPSPGPCWCGGPVRAIAISRGQQVPSKTADTIFLSLRRGVPNPPNKGVQ
jgi:hypothetical protein